MKIFRRDFLNNTLLAAGAALLKMPAPAAAQRGAPADSFTGYGGVGDYAGIEWRPLVRRERRS